MAILLTLAALILLAAALLWMLLPGRRAGAGGPSLAGIKFAHRGLYDNAGGPPENSLPAFAAAIEAGYGIELDIRLTKEGELVVFHDPSLQRVCGVAARVDSLGCAELRALRLAGSEERIPIFAEFLDFVRGRVPLLIEFKTTLPGAGPAEVEALCSKAMELLDRYEGPFFIESFDYLVLEWFKRRRPGVSRGQLAMGLGCYVPALGKEGAAAIPALRKLGLSWLLYGFRGRPHFIAYRYQDGGLALRLCRLLGAQAAAWTVRSKEEAERLASSYDAIIFEGFRP